MVAITSTPPAETDSHRRREGMSAGYGWSTYARMPGTDPDVVAGQGRVVCLGAR